MPPSLITADETDQAYLANQPTRRSVGSSGGIFRGQSRLLSPHQTRWATANPLLFSVTAFTDLEINTLRGISQS